MAHEGWNKAHNIDKYHAECKALGMNYSQMMDGLTYIDSRMEAYGDRHLWMDADGNYWEQYCSIGD